MKTGHVLIYCLSLFIFLVFVPLPGHTQQDHSDIHVVVNMVQVNIAVTDNKGNYVTGLRPEDFVITEDGIAEKIATFEEGNEPARQVDSDPSSSDPVAKQANGTATDSTGGLAAAIAGSPRRHQREPPALARPRPGRRRGSTGQSPAHSSWPIMSAAGDSPLDSTGRSRSGDVVAPRAEHDPTASCWRRYRDRGASMFGAS